MMNDRRARGQAPGADVAAAGLCARCAHVQVVVSARGSRFYLCRLSSTDPAFPRYPVIPVVACRGFDAACASIEDRMHTIAPARLKPGASVPDGPDEDASSGHAPGTLPDVPPIR